MAALPAPASLPATCAALLLTLSISALAVGAQIPKSNTPVSLTTTAVARPETAFTWNDLAGKQYDAAYLAKNKATVFLFSSTECPLASKYTPRLLALHKEYAAKGVAFFLVNSNSADSPQAFTKWAKERQFPFPQVKDKGTTLADRLNAAATPSAVVVDSTGNTIYMGRIDDNDDPAKVSRRDVAEALNDVLAGKPVRISRTRAVGCEIFRDKQPIKTAAAKPASRYTWAKDIAPLLEENCVVCHRKGDVGPFALDTYEQARVWASAIKDYTARRIMPPWKAEPGQGEFHDARYLTDDQLAHIAEWADGGAPKGNPKDLPPVPVRHAAGDWALGKPDVILKPTRLFNLEAEGEDVYRDFALPIDFEEDRYIAAFDFKPGNRTIVHHMIAYIDLTGETVRKRDSQTGEPGWSVSGGGSGIKDEDWGDGWAPGMNPRRLPVGIAVKIPKGAKLVLQVHYHKTGKPETDQSEMALYWSKDTNPKVLKTAPVGNASFVLKPEISGQEVKASIILPWDVNIWQLLPHMHMLGKEMKATAVLPDGTEKSLISIKNWEFNWQMNYRYKEPVALPRGTRINLVAKYDNTAANPNQPNNPPREVRYGEQTNDEMCFLFMGFTVGK